MEIANLRQSGLSVRVSAPKQGSTKTFDPTNLIQHSHKAATETGWQRVYELDPSKYAGVWLEFHASHKDAFASACLIFDLVLELRPAGDMQKMAQCSAGGEGGSAELGGHGLETVLTQDEFLPKFPAGNLQLPFRAETPLALVKEKAYGLVESAAFSLKEQAWVSLEVLSNFFLSDLQLVLKRYDSAGNAHAGNSGSKSSSSSDPGSTTTAVVDRATLEFANAKKSPITVKRWLGALLEPGTYVIVVRDENFAVSYASKTTALSGWGAWFTGGSSAKTAAEGRICVPLSFKMSAIPAGAAATPSILAVHPAASFPLAPQQPVVIRIRFSEPVSFQRKDDVARAITLGGIDFFFSRFSRAASTGGGECFLRNCMFLAKSVTQTLGLFVNRMS